MDAAVPQHAWVVKCPVSPSVLACSVCASSRSSRPSTKRLRLIAGTHDVFYDDPDILFISTHQAGSFPNTGALKEVGTGDGEGASINLPIPGALFITFTMQFSGNHSMIVGLQLRASMLPAIAILSQVFLCCAPVLNRICVVYSPWLICICGVFEKCHDPEVTAADRMTHLRIDCR